MWGGVGDADGGVAAEGAAVKHGPTRRGVVIEIGELIRRMAGENLSWDYTRIHIPIDCRGMSVPLDSVW